MNFILKFLLMWKNSNLMFKVGLVILSIHLIIAVTGPFWAPFHYAQMGAGKPLVGMNWINLFGTDHLGRDVFSRVVHGSYMVISLSIFGTMLGLVIGSFTGLLSAYIGGWVDELVQRFNEALISIPFLVNIFFAI